MLRSLPAVLALVACGAALPPGWDDAVSVPITQSACDGDPYSEHDEHVEVAAGAGSVSVDYLEAHFRCEQDVEAFVRVGGGAVDLLVQPIDMNPRMVAGCDCLYDISATIDDLDPGPTAVTVFRRWDDINEPNDPVEIGTVDVTVE